MNRKLVGLGAALAMAALGTALLVSYVHTAKAQATEGEKLVPVLVTTDKVAAGTKTSDLSGHLKTVQVPSKVKADGALTDLADVEGRVTADALVPGEQVVRSRFVLPTQLGRAVVPAGMLQVTVALDATRALGGQLAAGDTVAVVVSFDKEDPSPAVTHLILHKVQVTAVQLDTTTPTTTGTDAKSKATAPSGKVLVTLAVDAPSVERVVYAAEHGRVWLANEPKDANESGTRVVTQAVGLS